MLRSISYVLQQLKDESSCKSNAAVSNWGTSGTSVYIPSPQRNHGIHPARVLPIALHGIITEQKPPSVERTELTEPLGLTWIPGTRRLDLSIDGSFPNTSPQFCENKRTLTTHPTLPNHLNPNQFHPPKRLASSESPRSAARSCDSQKPIRLRHTCRGISRMSRGGGFPGSKHPWGCR